MRRFTTEAKVGLFVLLCLGVLAYMTLKVGKFRWGEEKGYRVAAVFDSVAGLKLNVPVEVAGVEVGRVVEIGLETGRRHQIRVQLAGIGCPIVGDVTYGASKALGHGRIALLARRTEFDHPTRKERMAFQSPVPDGWPWFEEGRAQLRPLWAIEEYMAKGLVLP